MAELAVFSLANKVLSAAASPALKTAYEKGLSIWEARGELDKLRATIETITAVLLDAEKKQHGSAAIRNWIKRLKAVLYQADDLFDEVATDDMVKQLNKKKGNKCKLFKKVQAPCFMLNTVMSSNSIANKVKDIRKNLLDISSDMAGLGFVRCDNVEQEIGRRVRRGQDPGSFVDSKDVIGRDDDKRVILEMLLRNELRSVRKDGPLVIAIVGIGGMGKTTLSQLVYNDERIKMNFESMWFACISDVYNDKEVLGKIEQSMCKIDNNGSSISDLQSNIRKSVEGKKFLLVLDDVWDEDRGRWLDRIRLLGGGAKGSRIIVTTRSSSVAMAVGAIETHNLEGLSEDDSWELFRKIAFVPGNEDDPRRIDIAKEMVKKCRNVPLAIRSLASLLFEKNTIEEWKSFRNEELSNLGHVHEDGIMPVLQLSYNHLPSILKQCFVACSLFPKGYRLYKTSLIYLWIAQGYIKSENEKQSLEDVSIPYFMHLLRRGFFQDVEKDRCGEIQSCKMHDLIHDLAQHVAGEENILLTGSSRRTMSPRHVSIGYPIDSSWVVPAPLLNIDVGLRSFMFMNGGSISGRALDELFANFQLLRTLSLSRLGLEEVPSCIGKLKHLRNIDLSYNQFQTLPKSMTNLVNLLRLDLFRCAMLVALPDDFRKLINLRYLNIGDCELLRHMPPGIEEMSCLQYLSHFIVGVERGEVKRSGLDVLAGLPLRGELSIEFENDIANSNKDHCFELPDSLQVLRIDNYPGVRIPQWKNGTGINDLTSLHLEYCLNVKDLSALRCLFNLKSLHLESLKELEYVEEELTEGSSSSILFPYLESLALRILPNLKGWRRQDHVATADPSFLFLSLSRLDITGCSKLTSMPLAPRVQTLSLSGVGCQVVQHLLSDEGCKSLRQLQIIFCDDIKTMEFTSPNLEEISICECKEVTSLKVEPFVSLRSLNAEGNKQLKNLHIPQPNGLKNLKVTRCPELELWGLDWVSFANLSVLQVDLLPVPEILPGCLRQRQAVGKLEISRPMPVYRRRRSVEIGAYRPRRNTYLN